MEETIFTKIVKGDIPCYKIAEDDRYFAFDLDDEMLGGMMVFAKKVAKAMKQVLPCQRIGVAVIGIDVPHNHIHLVPINGVGDLDFKAPRVQLSKEEFAETAAKISAAFNAL